MHIQNHEMECFQSNEMDTDDMIAILEHLDSCSFCLGQMIAAQEQNLSAAPGYLKEQILAGSSSLDMTAGISSFHTHRKRLLLHESLRTAATAAAALLLLFGLSRTNLVSFQVREPYLQASSIRREAAGQNSRLQELSMGISESLSRGSGWIAEYLNSISDKIINGGK